MTAYELLGVSLFVLLALAFIGSGLAAGGTEILRRLDARRDRMQAERDAAERAAGVVDLQAFRRSRRG